MDNAGYDIPDWDDEVYEGMSFADLPSARLDMCKRMYKKWREICFMLYDTFEPFLSDDLDIAEDEENEEDMEYDFRHGNDEKSFRMQAVDLLITARKAILHTRSAEMPGDNLTRLDEAAIIRRCATDIQRQLLTYPVAHDPALQNYLEVIIREIEVFRLLFVEWVNTFANDRPADEWGVFR